MASAVFHSSIGTSTAIFSKTHFPIPFLKDYSSNEFHCSIQYNSYSKRSVNGQSQRKRSKCVKAAVAESLEASPAARSGSTGDGLRRVPPEKKLRVLVAGGGIGGLVFALAAKKRGFDVMVFEKDLSAIRGEGQYRGPIQIQSNALAALEAIDREVAKQVMAAGCVTGDRISWAENTFRDDGSY